MAIRAALWVSILMGVVALLNLVTFVAMDGGFLSLALGLVLGALAVGLALQPSTVITDTEVQSRNLLGMTLRRLPIAGLDDLVVEDGKRLVHRPTGKRIASLGSFFRRSDVEAIKAAVPHQ